MLRGLHQAHQLYGRSGILSSPSKAWAALASPSNFPHELHKILSNPQEF